MKERRRQPRRVLAASFVVTVAAAPSIAACKKTPLTDGDPPAGNESAYVNRREDGKCYMSVPEHCPKGASCNPPPPQQVDCPANMRDAGDAPGVARRPAGKEDWIRIPGGLSYMAPGKCSYMAERFCAPPGKPYTCTPYPTGVEIKCSKIEPDGGTPDSGRPWAYVPTDFKVDPFTYKDGVGTCHQAPALDCSTGRRCEIPETPVVPCP
jgi:hypothetical protein